MKQIRKKLFVLLVMALLLTWMPMLVQAEETAERENVLLNQPFTVTVQPSDTMFFEFTAETEGYYSFYSESGEGNLNIHWNGKIYYGDGVDTQYLGRNYPYILAVWNDSDTVQTYTLCVREAVPVEKIVFEQDHYYGFPGESKRIIVSLYPVWSIPEEPIFTSSDEDVVYYDPIGSRYVTLADPGIATITATTQNGVSAQCTVTVHDYEPIQVGDSETITLVHGEEKRYEFTPETDGEYIFYMPRGNFIHTGEDEYGSYGYTEDFSLSIEQDGVSVGEIRGSIDYRGVSCEMIAGNTYILRARNDWGQQGEIMGTVTIDELIPPKSISITSENEEDMLVAGVGSIVLSYKLEEGSPSWIRWDDTVTWSVSDESVLYLVDTGSDSVLVMAFSAGKATVTATLENGISASYEVIVSECIDYGIISGDGAIIMSGTDDTLSVHIDAPFEKFAWHVYIDGAEVPSQNYLAVKGSTIITLDSEYLTELEPGWRCLTVYFSDGYASALFEIREKPEYVPGDANGDGKVNGKDGVLLAQYLAEWDVTINTDAADVNGDGKVNGKDGVLLAQYLAEWDVALG